MSTTCHLHIKSNHLPYIITGSLLFLLSSVFVLNFLQIFQIDSANAESKDVGTNVNLEETLPLPSVSPSSVALTLEPNAAGDFDSAAVTVGVSTNHVSGYTLTMNTVGTSTDLSHDSSSDYKIEALSAKTSATDFANLSSTASINKWGFATDNNGSDTGQTDAGYYYPVTNSENPTTIKVTDGPANVSDTQVTFATKGKDLAAGTYSNTVIFTTIANPTTRPIEDNMYMQDVTADMCADSESWDDTGKEYTVIDKRDNLSYKVRKLADGKCWMAQNFRMTKDTLTANDHSATLDSSDTDISSSKSPSTFEMPNNVKWSGSSSDHLLKGAADATKLPVGSSSGTPASGETAVARGAYYSWCTATADCTNDVSTGIHQENSICPKGWRLANPNNGSSDNNNEYYKLYNSYAGSSQYTDFMKAFNTYYSSGASYYLAGGWSASSSGQYVVNAGAYGNWWSSTSHSSSANGAWGLNANTSSVSPASNGNRYFGFPVRCLL